MSDKKYCGNARTIETKNGKMVKISMTADDVKTLQENLNNGWVNINIGKRKEPSAKGLTHYLYVDEWKPGN